MVIAFAIVAFIFYFANIPVYFSVKIVVAARGTALCSGAAAFVPPKLRAPRKGARAMPRPNPFLFSVLRRMIKSIRLVRLSLRGTICAPDAMRTAILCGAAGAMQSALSAAAPAAPIYMEVMPDFSDGNTEIALLGIFSITFGQIIASAASGAAEYMKGRMQ